MVVLCKMSHQGGASPGGASKTRTPQPGAYDQQQGRTIQKGRFDINVNPQRVPNSPNGSPSMYLPNESSREADHSTSSPKPRVSKFVQN